MKKFPFILILVMALGSVFTSCFKNDDEKIADDYAEWREANTAWYKEQAARTEGGKFIYGFLIGAMAIVIRVLNPGFPEGMMLAILLMNTFAPLIDHFFIQANINRRKKRVTIKA